VGTTETDDYNFKYDHTRMRTYDQIVNIVKQASNQVPILDTRVESVFGQGSIPSSVNIPFTELINSDKTFKSVEELQHLLTESGIEKP
jgi:rhodanese-related sulfurtransferase